MPYSRKDTMVDTTAAQPLVLRPDDQSRPFFDGASRDLLVLQRCARCGVLTWPVRSRCPECWAADMEWTPAAGTGTVFAYSIVHQLYHPALAADIPYNVCLIELDEGVRIHARLQGIPNDEIRVGMPVSVKFEHFADGTAIARFIPR